MKKKKGNRFLAVVLLAMIVALLLSGCGKKSRKQENKETIRVYLWSTNLYEKYAPYILKIQNLDRMILILITIQ